MKKKLIAALCALLSTASFAKQIMIYNDSPLNMTVTYKIASEQNNVWTYGSVQSAKIPANVNQQKNYIILSFDSIPDKTHMGVFVLSDNLSDDNGNVKVKADFRFNDQSICNSSLISSDDFLNGVVAIQQKGVIATCAAGSYLNDVS